jgi:EAL domain-containing protein (putative c-di-GMP-specific phosphodiesterase class I)/GGDEF domain-containing protein
MKKKYVIQDILKNHNITSWFQPIIDVEKREIIGWEAFSRGLETKKGLEAPEMFDSAAEAGILKPLDLMCIHTAAENFDQLQLENKLFINISNELLIASSRLKAQVGKLISDNKIPATSMVLEIDEKSATNNLQELSDAVNFFHEQGFEVAIDHLSGIDNVGESSTLHRLWSELKPEYIKLDRGFVQNVNGSANKQKTIKELVSVARAIGSTLVAEGVETQKELKKLYDLGVHHVQGFLIQKPELAPTSPNLEELLDKNLFDQTNQKSLACDLVVSTASVKTGTTIKTVFDMLESNVHLSSIAVLENDAAIGIIYRKPFLEQFSKRQRREVVQDKCITTVMSNDFLHVTAHQRIEQVSRLVTSRAQVEAEHDFIISNEQHFLGIGTVIDLLRKVTQLRVQPDHQENILTMLPGNTPLGSCVKELLNKDDPFTIALLDLANFKPFNNHYSHYRGDEVLIMFAEILKKHLKHGANFAGHIGGDDFVLIMPEEEWQEVMRSIFTEFEHKVLKFYSGKDIQQGGIESTDRNGHVRHFDFISLSAGVLTVTDEYFESFQSLLTQLIQLKQRTKRDEGTCLAYLKSSQIKLYSFNENDFVDEGVTN